MVRTVATTPKLDMFQRYYSSIMGRFLTPDPYKAGSGGNDPANPQSWNRYAYLTDDPINWIDPTGEFQCNPAACDPVQFPGPIGPAHPPTPPNSIQEFYDEHPEQCVTTRPKDPNTDSDARSKLNTRLQNFGQTNCDKVFGAVIQGYTTSGFTSQVGKTEFYNVTNTKVAALTQNQVVGNGDSTRLGSSVPVGTDARTLHGSLGTAVLLAANFYSNPDASFQQNVLLHELLHAYTGGWSDPDIFGAFRDYGLQQINPGSGDITAWLQEDCTKTPPGVR